MSTRKEDVGGRIRQIRSEQKLKQDAFGRLLGIGKQSVSNYENGVSFPNPEFLVKIAKIGNKTLDWLITGQDDPPGIDRQVKLAKEIVGEPPGDYAVKPLTIDEQTLLHFYRQIPDEKKPTAIERVSALLISSRASID